MIYWVDDIRADDMAETRNGKRRDCGGWFDESQEINEDNNMEEVIFFYHDTVDGITYD